MGPHAYIGGAAVYREFACAVFRGVASEYLVAIQPASATQLDFVTLHPSQRRRAGTGQAAPANEDFAERIIIVDRANRTIELQDQSVWRVQDPRGLFATWQDGDRITVQPGNFYGIVDLTRRQTLNGSFLGYDD